jgi:hypothetical protein
MDNNLYNVLINLIPVLTGGLIALFGTFLSSIYSTRKEYKRILFEQKLKVYQELMLVLVDFNEQSIKVFDENIKSLRLACANALIFCNELTKKHLERMLDLLLCLRRSYDATANKAKSPYDLKEISSGLLEIKQQVINDIRGEMHPK